MPTLRLIACLTIGLAAAACGGMSPEQELKLLTPEEARTPGGATMTQGSAVTLVTLAREHEARLRSLLEEVEQRAARGEATATDVAQVEARLAAARARRSALEGELAASCARFRELVGQPAPGCAP
ncbi:MAG: TolC family protein [Kiloniellales bacterium]